MNFLQVIVNSLPQMAIYSLATIGIVLIFRTTGTTNFAQGLIATLGTFMTTQMALYAGLPLWLGVDYRYGGGVFDGHIHGRRADSQRA